MKFYIFFWIEDILTKGENMSNEQIPICNHIYRNEGIGSIIQEYHVLVIIYSQQCLYNRPWGLLMICAHRWNKISKQIFGDEKQNFP